jgi:hypothetical protein
VRPAQGKSHPLGPNKDAGGPGSRQTGAFPYSGLLRAPATLDQMKTVHSPELGRSPFWERSSRALPDPETAPASETSRPARAAAVKSPTGSAESGRGSYSSPARGTPVSIVIEACRLNT